MKPVKVGICGLGTVGGGTFNVLTRNAQDIARRAGREIIIAQVATVIRTRMWTPALWQLRQTLTM